MPYVFVTGGASSGKSRFALERFKELTRVAFIATGVATDPEMEERILAHRKERPPGWETIEEPVDLEGALESVPPGTEGIILDCLTLWVSNLLYRGRKTPSGVLSLAARASGRVSRLATPAVVITNELGSGIVPATEEARRFRKTAGEVNQIFARECAEAYLVVSGIGVKIK